MARKKNPKGGETPDLFSDPQPLGSVRDPVVTASNAKQSTNDPAAMASNAKQSIGLTFDGESLTLADFAERA